MTVDMFSLETWQWKKLMSFGMNIPMILLLWKCGLWKNLDFMLYYIKDAPSDLNLLNKDDTPFILRIKNQLQLKMMTKFEDRSLVLFVVTLHTN